MPIRPNSNANMDVRRPPLMPPDFKIHQMNRRMQERPENNDIQWWDMFVTEFFEDKSSLTLSFFLEDGPKRYAIGRTLIPRFFKTMFESGVVDMNFVLLHPKDCHSSASSILLECDMATMVMHYVKPLPTKVYAEGQFVAEFSADEYMRMRTMHFSIRNHVEFIPRQATMQSPAVLEDLSKNVTRAGLTPSVLNFLKMCVILEPMKELMSRQKTYNMEPVDCLKNCLFQKWSRMLNPPTDAPRTTKRMTSRKRKNSTTANASSANQGSKKKPPFASADVMYVGEPTLMGSEFGDEDERTIQRLENNQFDNQMHVKSEDRDPAVSFPSVSSPNTTQWQQAIPSAMQNNAVVTPKSETTETSTEQSTTMVTTS